MLAFSSFSPWFHVAQIKADRTNTGWRVCEKGTGLENFYVGHFLQIEFVPPPFHRQRQGAGVVHHFCDHTYPNTPALTRCTTVDL